ncbi:MAG: radical SAM protein [Planctomycetes bacterium]|nr:radical SAM protein [Planctomycetota bacterium]
MFEPVDPTTGQSIVEAIDAEIDRIYMLYLMRAPTHAERLGHREDLGRLAAEASGVLREISPEAVLLRMGIRPLNVELDITTQCNLRCVMCHFSHPEVSRTPRSDLPPPAFDFVARQILPLTRRLSLSFGTEPLLNDHIADYVRLAKELEVPDVYFVSNAMRLTEPVAERLLDAGLDGLNVSLDATTGATYSRVRRGGSLSVVLENLKALRNIKRARGMDRPRLSLSFVLMRSTLEEAPFMIDLACEMQAESVHYMHLVPYTYLQNEHESLIHCKERCNEVLAEIRTRAQRAGIRLREPGDFPREVQALGREEGNVLATTPVEVTSRAIFDFDRSRGESVEADCPFPWHFVGIDAVGNVYPCGHWLEGGPMGNLQKDSFEEIWSGHAYQGLRDSWLRRQLTRNCLSCPSASMGRVTNEASFRPRDPFDSRV